MNAHTLASMPRGGDEVKNPLTGGNGAGRDPGAPAAATRTKPEWRRWAVERRAGLDVSVVSGHLLTVLSAWLDSVAPTTVLAYRATADELSIDAVVAQDVRHSWAVTRTPPQRPLTVHAWDSPLERHRFGYDQPVAGSPAIDTAVIAVVLVPGLLFDSRGVRLGYGKGYYDELLTTLAPGTRFVGVTCTALRTPALPAEDHDVVMTHVADERGVHAVPEPPR